MNKNKKENIVVIVIAIIIVAITASVLTWFFAKTILASNYREKVSQQVTKTEKTDIEQESNKEDGLLFGSYKLQDDTCSESECLFYEYNSNTKDFPEGWPIGIAKVRGYYMKDVENKKLLPTGCDKVDVSLGCVEYEAEKCDRFVVTDGYEKMIPSFGRRSDNTIKINLDKFDKEEEKIIGKEYSQISERDINVILKSNKSKEIQLVLLAFKPELTVDVDYCYSRFDILKVIE